MSSEVNGRKMTGVVTHWAGEFYEVVIKVVSTDAKKPLTGKVTFHLHDSFVNQTPEINVEDGEAVLILKAYGAFTVGAVADGGKTKLELDLAEDPNAPKEFRSR
jgi:hypothetical protein